MGEMLAFCHAFHLLGFSPNSPHGHVRLDSVFVLATLDAVMPPNKRNLKRSRIVSSVAKAMHLADIVESSSDAIYSRSLDGVVTSWNTAAERIFGYRGEEIVGKSGAVLFPPDRVDE